MCAAVGNCTAVAAVTGLKVDRALPAITCVPPPTWSKGTAVTIACTATDEGSGLAAADQSFSLTASAAAGTAGLVVTTSRQVCDKAGNCVDTPNLGAIGLDDQAPVVACQTTPGDWQIAKVAVSCTATDGSGSGLADDSDAAFEISATVADGTIGSQVALGNRAVCDKAGNCARTPAFAAGRIDRVMPKAVCQKPTGTFAAEVTVTCVASDVGSGLADPGQATFTLRTDVGPGNHDASAVTSTRQVCDIAGNCITAGPVGPFDIDRTKPAPGSAPVLSLPGAVHVLAARAASGAFADLADPVAASVPVPFTLPAVQSQIGAEVGCTPDNAGSYPIGDTLVSCTARDGADRTTDGSFTVSVEAAPDLAPAGPIWSGGAIRYAGRGFSGPVSIELDGVVIGTTTSTNGAVKGGFLIPAGTALGSHLVVLRGAGPDGDPQLVVMPITLSDDPADAQELPGKPPVQPPGDGVPIGGHLPQAVLELTAKPKRDRTAPYRFTVTATLSGDTCTGSLVARSSAKLRKGKKASWRPVGPTRTTAVRGCTTSIPVTVSAGKLAQAVKRSAVPVRIAVTYVDAAGRTRVVATVTVRAR